ncbi:MAG: hypothetical protein AAF662_01810 [Pseudomonadota bacterium]
MRSALTAVAGLIAHLLLTGALAAQSTSSGDDFAAGAIDLPESSVGDEQPDELAFRSQRETFLEQRTRIVSEEEALQAQISARQQSLAALDAERAELLAKLGNKVREEEAATTRFTQRFETWATSALHPLRSTAFSLGTDTSIGGSHTSAGELVWIHRSNASVSYGLPIMLALLWILLRRNHNRAYLRWKSVLNPLVIALIVLFPLSAVAQHSTALEVEREKDSLALNLAKAQRLLALSQTQRYLHSLQSYESQGRRISVDDLDLSDSPLQPTTNVLVGSAEAVVLRAALHIKDGQNAQAVDALRELADDARFSTSANADRRFEASLSGAIRFLVSENEHSLAQALVSQFGPTMTDRGKLEAQLIQPSTVDFVFETPGGFDADESRGSAVVLADITYGASNAFSDRGISRPSYTDLPAPPKMSESIEPTQQKPVQTSLQEMARFAVIENSKPLMRMAIEAAHYDPGGVQDVTAAVDALVDAGFRDEAIQLINNAIAFYGSAPRDASAELREANRLALTRLSVACFRRGLLQEAKLALVDALKPLSSTERRLLATPLPPDVVDPWRLPEPELLVAPLYLGLIEERMGLDDSARLRFQSENERLLAAVVDGSGLNAPHLLNHLTLLGSSLDTTQSEVELAEINTLLNQLEGRSLEDLRRELAPTVAQHRTQLEQLDLMISEREAQVERLQEQVARAEEPEGKPGLASVLLLMRFLGLVLVSFACIAAPICIAFRYTRTKPLQKTSAFFWKLVETVGWVWILSVFSLPVGLGAILLSQFFLANQRQDSLSASDEDPLSLLIESINEVWPAPVEASDVSASLAKEMLQGENVSDNPWSNVIELLRETRS